MSRFQFSFARTLPRLGLYPVVDSLLWIERLLDCGVTTLQLRVKDQPLKEVETQIKAAIQRSHRYQARLFINDYWSLAIRCGAYGVHLGQEDMATADLAAIADAGLRLGLSTHDPRELQHALNFKPSYVALGHIFPTQTKQMPSSPQGLVALKQAVIQAGECPTVAIGGISIARVPEVLATGVGSVALVSAITQATDWRLATRSLRKMIDGVDIGDSMDPSDAFDVTDNIAATEGVSDAV